MGQGKEQGKEQCWALVNMIMNFWVPFRVGNILTCCMTITF
jgi:hypothetical protein